MYMSSNISTGFQRLDKLIPNWTKSHVIVIASRPAIGKSSFAVSLVKNIAVKQNIPSLFFSLEMPTYMLTRWLVCNICELDYAEVSNGELDEENKAEYELGLRLLEESPLFIDDSPTLFVSELKSKIEQGVSSHDVKFVFIDFLQLLSTNTIKFNDRQEELTFLMKSLRDLATALNITVVVNVSLPAHFRKPSIPPDFQDLKLIGSIDEWADIVLYLHRPVFYSLVTDSTQKIEPISQVFVGKNSFGEKGDCLLYFRPEQRRFYC